SYWICLDIDPKKIDVNIHPTKTEIKFEDERSVYAIVRASVKRSLGQYSVTPSLDFERETSFDIPSSDRYKPVVRPGVTVNTEFNPFNREHKKNDVSGWERLYEDVKQAEPFNKSQHTLQIEVESAQAEDHFTCFQIANSTIVCEFGGNGVLLIDQQSAHERILFEHLIANKESGTPVQKELFPSTLTFNANDAVIIRELIPDLLSLGFDLQEFGGNSFVLQGSPVSIEKGTEQSVLEGMIENYRNSHQTNSDFHLATAKSFARSMALRRGRRMAAPEMERLVRDLLKCEEPALGIDGKPCSWMLTNDEILSRMRRNQS
ncbi:MAG: hypothetical protein ACKOKF_00725, partial [Bacteroidota bacterium]